MTQLQAHPAAGWYVDPSGRHEARYWDGDRWTERIADRGVENHDVRAAADDAHGAAPDTQTVQVETPTEVAAAYAGAQAGDPPVVAAEPVAESVPTEPVEDAAPAEPAADPFADFIAEQAAQAPVAEISPLADSPGDSPELPVAESDSPADSPFVEAPVVDSPADSPVDMWADASAFASPVVDSPADSPVDMWADAPTFAGPIVDAPVVEPPPFVSPTVDSLAVAAPAGPEVGWYPDPAARHEVRYWDGGRWTERVANDGVEQMDAPATDILDTAATAATVDASGDLSDAAGPAAEYTPDWYPDPTGRHEMRYFDGTTWTEHVANNGLSALDPIADGAPVAAVETTLAASIVPAVSTATSPNATTAEAAEAAFAAALKPAVEAAPEPEPVVKQLPVRPDWAARPNALVGWIVVIGAGVLGIGSLGPWAKATAPVVGEVTQNGTSGDGRFMLALALLLLATGAGLIVGRLGRIVAFSALSLGTLAAIVCAVDMARISNGTYGLLQGTADVTSTAGMGLWACLVGAIVCIAGGIVAVTHR